MILITGADGFIGSYLLNKFTEWNIDCTGTFISEVDLASRSNLFDFAAHMPKIDLIIHCATAARSGTEYGADCFQNNVKMYLNILDLASEHNCSLISFGSGSDTNRNFWSASMDEYSFTSFPPPSNDHHADSKATIARLINLSSFKKQLSLRLFGVFGEGENYLYKLVPNTIAKLLHQLPIVLVRDRIYNYIDVYDLARFLRNFYQSISDNEQLLAQGKIPNIINFCSPTPIKLSRIVTYLISQISHDGHPLTILNSEPGLPYSGTTRLISSHFPDFSFSPLEDSLNRQICYYKRFLSDFDKSLLISDDYLSYALRISK